MSFIWNWEQSQAWLDSRIAAQVEPRSVTSPTSRSRSVTRVAIPTSSTLVRITEPKSVVLSITNDSGSDLFVSLAGAAEVTIATDTSWTTTAPGTIHLRAATSNQTAIIYTEVYS